MRACLKIMLIILTAVVAPAVSPAADSAPPVLSRGPAAAAAPGSSESTIIIEQQSPVRPAPTVRYGCSRIWRCDSVICEWRRGCWGVYGYMEGPYYTLEFAKRQWERQGWPVPPEYKSRYSLSK